MGRIGYWILYFFLHNLFIVFAAVLAAKISPTLSGFIFVFGFFVSFISATIVSKRKMEERHSSSSESSLESGEVTLRITSSYSDSDYDDYSD